MSDDILGRAGIDEFHGGYFARATGHLLTWDRRTALRIAMKLNVRGWRAS